MTHTSIQTPLHTPSIFPDSYPEPNCCYYYFTYRLWGDFAELNFLILLFHVFCCFWHWQLLSVSNTNVVKSSFAIWLRNGDFMTVLTVQNNIIFIL